MSNELKGKILPAPSLRVYIRKDNSIKVNLQNGARGKSAYETWLSLGNEGSEQDFIDYLIDSIQDTNTAYYELYVP